MFKIISAEIKKTVSKPGIYILAILLAIILVLGTFAYNPKIVESEKITLNGNTYIEKYNDFIGNGESNAGKKAEITEQINTSIKSVNNYNIELNSTKYSQKEYITLLLTKFEETYADYQDCANDQSDNNYINTIARPALVASLENLNKAIEESIINYEDGSYSLITSKDNYKLYKDAYKASLSWSKINVLKENLNTHIQDFETKHKQTLFNSIQNFKYPILSENFIKDYTSTETGTKLSIINERLAIIDQKIQENYKLAEANIADNNKLANKMDELANLYIDTAKTYTNLVKYELLSNAFDNLKTNEQINALSLSDYSEYDSNSHLIRYEYLFKNNKGANEYNRPLTIGITSGNEINAYDYTYFVLKLFSFVIIAYAIMAACHSIAGEIKEGSMRYLAIRPVNRTSMFLGKWLAIMLMSLILIIFSSVIAVCVGGAVYGFESLNILTIFNGTTAVTMHPIVMIVIFLLNMFLELTIYSALAMLLSCMFKSDLLSVTLLLVLYLINVLLPVFVQGANTWLAFYPFSHISIYALFGSSIYATSNDFFNLLLGSKIYVGSSILLTSSIISILIIAFISLAVKIFKNKEL